MTSLRASWRLGRAQRKRSRGDHFGVMNECSEALRLLGKPNVDRETPWCRATASVALSAYCRAAHTCGREGELLEMLERWRPTYLPWLVAPTTADEAKYLKWLEELVQSKRTGKPLG